MSFRSFSYSLFGFLGKNYQHDVELGRNLNKAHIEMSPDAYIAWAATMWLIVSLTAVVTGLLVYAVFIPAFEKANTEPEDEVPFELNPIIKGGIVGGIIAGIPLITLVYFVFLALPMKIAHRGKTANLYLPHAASFVSAMSASNATMSKIFFALANQKAKKTGANYYLSKWFGMDTTRDVFPIISEESASIYRDMNLLGVDTLSAIQSAVERAPSPWLAEFFQGISSTISSGGNLKLYFLNSAERFMEDIKQQQRETLDQLATQAEMFVTVAVAMPIFLIIILIITIWVSTSGSSTGDSLSTLYMVIFMLVPLLHFMFATMTYLNIKKFQI